MMDSELQEGPIVQMIFARRLTGGEVDTADVEIP
jgi:hypothetical protein